MTVRISLLGLLLSSVLSLTSFAECDTFGSYFGVAPVTTTTIYSSPTYVLSGYQPTYSVVYEAPVSRIVSAPTVVYVEPTYAHIDFNIYNIPNVARFWLQGAEHTVPETSMEKPIKLRTTAVRVGPYYWFDFVIKYPNTEGDTVTMSKRILTTAGATVNVDVDTFPYYITKNVAATAPTLPPKLPSSIPRVTPSTPVKPTLPPKPTKPERDMNLPELDLDPPKKPEHDPATLELDMPREARIWVDGKLVRAGVRTLKTPPLKPNQNYAYDVSVEYEEKDESGQKKLVSAERKIVIKSGDSLMLTKDTFSPSTVVLDEKDVQKLAALVGGKKN